MRKVIVRCTGPGCFHGYAGTKEVSVVKKVIIGLVAIVLAIGLLSLPASVEGQGKKVVYTSSTAVISDGAFFPQAGGFTLFDDGSVTGVTRMTLFDGNVILVAHGATWSYVVPGEFVQLCTEVHVVKNVTDLPDEVFVDVFACSPPKPVSGLPLFVDLNGDGEPDVILRLTPVGQP
jgi:hypothetical protein